MGNAEEEIGVWLIQEANKSYKYWHSSAGPRSNMSKPMFDKNQCHLILDNYRDDSKRLA